MPKTIAKFETGNESMEPTSSTTISSETFGANYLFKWNSQEKTDALLNELNVSYVRYPGGSMSEHFDIKNPFSNVGLDGEMIIPLDSFLDSAKKLDASFSFVFMPESFPEDVLTIGDGKVMAVDDNKLEAYLQDVKEFVFDHLLNNSQGVPVSSFELGNETTLNFGDGVKMGYVATAISEAISASNGDQSPDLIVQFSHHGKFETHDPNFVIDFNDTHRDEFIRGLHETDALDLITGVQMHNKYSEGTMGGEYTQEYSTIENRMDVIEHSYLDFVEEMNSYGVHTDLKLFDTEWNLKIDGAHDDTPAGLESVAYILELASEMVELGFDKTSIWAVNRKAHDFRGSLGNGEDLRPAGLAYKSMNENLERTKYVDFNNEVFSTEGTLTADFHVFQSFGKTVVYAHNMTGDELSFDLDFSTLVPDFAEFESLRIGIAEGEDPTSGMPFAVGAGLTLEEFGGTISNLEFNADAYETIVLRFDSDINVMGTNDDEHLHGERGNDVLHGKSGDDTLSGDQGDDVLYGGAGDDVLYGGTGNDIYYGGSGADVFVYASGDGSAVIKDFDGKTDRLDVVGFNISSDNDVIDYASQVGSNVVIELGDDQRITIENVLLDNIFDV